ncbi:unnamed protein product [Closterium sp. NIES-53]
MDAEMASWKSTGTYVDEVPPPGANIVSGMWIFRVKRPPGSPPVFKARYVARGFSQRHGFDFFQTFSPTPKMTTLRALLHVAAQRDYELHSLDFSTAFLQGSLHEEIWLRRPPGFTESFPTGTQWSLRRPVYGLRQAPREWHDMLRTTLASLGFAPSTADPSLFLRTDATLPPFYVLVYVDDLVFATADTEALALVKSELQKRHTCTDLGELTSYLGLRITRDRAHRTITLTQSHMVQQVLQRFGFTYSSPQSTPLPTGHSLSAPPSDESVEPSGPYPELVGCLMYLMTGTRPDLAYPLSLLARYVAPGRHRKVHWDAAKRVLRYLCSTSGMGLVLGGRARVVLTGHADASWVDDLATQRSSQGYTFSLGSGSVSWRSTRSSSVLSSSCEAEIYAGAIAAQELRWLTYLLTYLGEVPRSPPVVYVDNKAMLALCQEHRLEHRTKHIALCYFLARELQQRGQLRLAYVASQAKIADVFTKALQPCDHQPCFAFLDRSCDLLFSPTLPMGVFLLVPNSFASSIIPDSSQSYALLVAYVDDILCVGSSTSLGDRIEADLKKSLDLTISTKVTQFLGLNVSRTSSAIHLTALKYAESLAKRFNISTDFVATPYRSTLTGHVPNLKNLSAAGLQLYEQQLGCLLFAAVTCRPDLAYIASHLAQFLRCPKEEHSLDLQRALRYYVSTPTLGLIFNAGKPTDKMYLSGYVEADHAGDTSDRRSRTGSIFRLEPIGPISWNSSKQELVSLSSAAA